MITLFLESDELTSIHPDRILITDQRNYPIPAQFIWLTYNRSMGEVVYNSKHRAPQKSPTPDRQWLGENCITGIPNPVTFYYMLEHLPRPHTTREGMGGRERLESQKECSQVQYCEGLIEHHAAWIQRIITSFYSSCCSPPTHPHTVLLYHPWQTNLHGAHYFQVTFLRCLKNKTILTEEKVTKMYCVEDSLSFRLRFWHDKCREWKATPRPSCQWLCGHPKRRSWWLGQ